MGLFRRLSRRPSRLPRSSADLVLERLEERILLGAGTSALPGAPTVGSLSDSPDPVTTGEALELTADSVSDPDGSVFAVEFYLDDGDGTFESDQDTQLGSGTDQGGGTWTLSEIDTTGWAAGTRTYFARAQDDFAIWGEAASTTGQVNAACTLGSVTAAPDPVSHPNVLTLSASGVSDADGTVVSVKFYYDTNENGQLEVATDRLLGTDSDGADGWSVGVESLAIEPGWRTVLAVAVDDAGGSSEAVATSLQVLPPAGEDVIVLGPTDMLAIDQPRVQFALDAPDSGIPGFYNGALLDTAANGILLGQLAYTDTDYEQATRDDGSLIYYEELGVSGTELLDLLAQREFFFAGSNGVPFPLGEVQMMGKPDLNLGSFAAIVGMPAMADRITTMDYSVMTGGGGFGDVNYLEVSFPDQIPDPTATTYQTDFTMLEPEYPGQQQPSDPLPTFEALPMIAGVDSYHRGHSATSTFVMDTGAQTMIFSTQMTSELGIDPEQDALGYLEVGGIGGSTLMPLVEVERLSLPTREGVDLMLTDLVVGVLDIPGISGVLGMNTLTSGYMAPVMGGMDEDGYFLRNWLDFTGEEERMLTEVNPDYHTVISGPEPADVTIGSFLAEPNPLGPAHDLVLTAQDVQSADGTVQTVEFYRDSDANGVLETGTDLLLDSVEAVPWTTTLAAPGWTEGQHLLFAVATDDGGSHSDPATATVTVDLTGPRVLNHVPSGTLSPGVSHVDVEFSEPINEGTFSTDDVSLLTPAGTEPVSGIAHQGGNTYRISFAQQSRAGTHTVEIGPEIEDLAGNSMDQDEDGVQGEAAQDVYDGAFTVANEPPTDITLDSTEVQENQPAGIAVGNLGTSDPNTGESFTYAPVGGEGDDDNGLFSIDGDILRTNQVFDFEAAETYTIRLRTVDSADQILEKQFVISIENVVENDLTPTSVAVTSNHVLEGEFEFDYSVRNLGQDAAPAFSAAIVLSDDEVVGNEDDQVVDTLALGPLTPGETASGTYAGTLDKSTLFDRAQAEDPPAQAPGYQSDNVDWIGLVVDPENVIQETNEDNNIRQEQGVGKDHITYFPWDVDDTAMVTATDAIFVINRLGAGGPDLDGRADLDGNGMVTPSDAIAVINRLGYEMNSGMLEASSTAMLSGGGTHSPTKSGSMDPAPQPGAFTDGLMEAGLMDSDSVRVELESRDLDGIPGIIPGETFEVDVHFVDVRDPQNPAAVFSGYADIEFDPTLLRVDGITRDAGFPLLPTGTIDQQAGVVEEAGATAEEMSPADDTRVFTLQITALAAGSTTISTNVGEDAISEVVVFGEDDDQRQETDFRNVDIEIVDALPEVATNTYGGGVRVSVYDMDGGLTDDEVAWRWRDFRPGTTRVVVDAGWEADRHVHSVVLFGDGTDTEGVGIVVEGNERLGQVIDARSGATFLAFLASEGGIGTVVLNGGLSGADLSGMAPQRDWMDGADLDGDGTVEEKTALYTGGGLDTFITGNHVMGDVIAEGRIGFAMTRGGNFAGDLVSQHLSVQQLLVIDGNIDLRNGRRINSASTINSIQAINGDLLGDADDETWEIDVGDGSLWSLQAINGQIDGLAARVQTSQSRAWQGTIGDVLTSGRQAGISGSHFAADRRINSVGVYGPWGSRGDLSNTAFHARGMGSVTVSRNAAGADFHLGSGDLGSFHAARDVTDSVFDVDSSFWWMNAGRDMHRTTVGAANLNAVAIGRNLGDDSTLTDEDGGVGGDDWWMGVGGRWHREEGHHRRRHR